MAERSADDARVLLEEIAARRREVARYLARVEPQNAWLINLSIVCGALAAVLTAGPAVGGDGFIVSVGSVVSFDLPVWQVLCFAASLLSMAVVIANGLLKTYDLTSKVTTTRTCDAKLEGLETMLRLGQISTSQATQQYTQCLTEIAHVRRRAGA